HDTRASCPEPGHPGSTVLHSEPPDAGFVGTDRRATGFVTFFSVVTARDCNAFRAARTLLTSALTPSCCFESFLMELSIRESFSRMASSFSPLLLFPALPLSCVSLATGVLLCFKRYP